MTQAHLHSIYLATEGEGIHLRTPQVFVRFQGCNIGCLNCDSRDTWDFTSQGTGLDRVMQDIFRHGDDGAIRRVSITGGDPLHPQHLPAVCELARRLKAARYWVNLEASGTRIVQHLFELLDFISFDLKPPSTGVKMDGRHLPELVDHYPERFQIKTVIETEEDFAWTLERYRELKAERPHACAPWCLTPCYKSDEAFPRERFQKILAENTAAGGPFRVIGQQHKWIYGPSERSV